MAFTKATPGVETGLGVVALGLLGADGQVAHEHVGPGVAQRLGHVDGLGRRLLHDLAVVGPEPVEGRAPLHGHVEVADRGELDGVVVAGEDRLGQVHAHLGGVHVEGGHELDVAHVVAAQGDVHQPRHDVLGVGVAVVLHALDERAGAVAHAGDRDPYRAHVVSPSSRTVCIVLLPTSAGPGADRLDRARRRRVAPSRARSASISRSSQAMSRSVDSVVCSMSDRA